MASYTVHLPTAGPDTLQRARFIRDGFSWGGIVLGPLWLIAGGAWISGLIVIGVLAGFVGLGVVLKLPPAAIVAGGFLLNLLVALEGATFQRWELELKGWREAGLVAGDDLETLEQRFFTEMLAESAATATSGPVPLSVGAPRPSAPGVIGLFPTGPQGHARPGP